MTPLPRSGRGQVRPIADFQGLRQTPRMNVKSTLLLSLLLCACGQQNGEERSKPFVHSAQSERNVEEVEAKVLSLLGETGNVTWVNWPNDLRYFSGTDEPCLRVSEQSLEAAIRLLSQNSALPIDRKEYEDLIGAAPPENHGTPYLLRGFSTSNSAARVTVIGDAVTVHSDALGGLGNIRRHPCVAVLNTAPSAVYTVVAYDL